MKFEDYCKVWEEIENTQGNIAKMELVKQNFSNNWYWMTTGSWTSDVIDNKTNFSRQLLLKTLDYYYNVDSATNFKQSGDLGTLIYGSTENVNSVVEIYEIEDVFNKIKMSSDQHSKMFHFYGLYDRCTNLEKKYLCRLVGHNLRIGVNVNMVLKTLAQKFNVEYKDVGQLHIKTNNWDKTIMWLNEDKPPRSYKWKVGNPLRPQLSKGLKQDDSDFKSYIIEPKYDGVRAQIHCQKVQVFEENVDLPTIGYQIKIFTRQLEDITDSVPEIVNQILKVMEKNGINHEFVVEGEILAYTPEGKMLPFQQVLKRIRRKHDIESMMSSNPLKIVLFDCIYWIDENLLNEPFSERNIVLSKFGNLCTKCIKGTINSKETKEYFEEMVKEGHEGLMIKDMDATYVPGERNSNVVKWKLDFRTIDCLLIKGYFGAGKRGGKIGAIDIGLRKDNGEIVKVNRVGSGFSDSDMDILTSICYTDGYPMDECVVEVKYGDVTEDGKMRFPVFVGVRNDLNIDDVKSIVDIR